MKIHKKLLLIFLVAGTSFSSAKATSTEFSLMQGMMTIAAVTLVPIGIGNIIGRGLLPISMETKRKSKEYLILIGGALSGVFTTLILTKNMKIFMYLIRDVLKMNSPEGLLITIGLLTVASTILGMKVTKNNYSTSPVLVYPDWLINLLKPVESFLQVTGNRN